MNRRVWLVGAVVLGLMGCTHQQTRLQKEDDNDREKEAEVDTIGKKCQFGNADPVPASGVGLVVGLDGTGSAAPPGGYRSILEHYLLQRRVENIKDLLSSPTTSLVLVSAMIPPGSRKGDPVDVEITLPRDSKTTSLRGGILLECELVEYDSKKHLAPSFEGQDALLKGRVVARGKGPLVVGFGDGDAASKLRQARIWGGGTCSVPRALYLYLNNDQQYSRVAKAVADRINETFQGSIRGPLTDVAVAHDKNVVFLSVPAAYRLNAPRYLRVVRLIPMRETEASRVAYRRRLEEQLMDPARAVTTALRLEALGQDSIPTLKRGLASEHPLVRFCSAESLAYLGCPSCGEELARMVEQQPALRAFSLTALASLDEAVCHVELRRLLASPSPETRYGAFRALRALDEQAEAVQGEHLNDSFWLHRVAPNSPPLIHLATNRAETVLFGEDALLIPPFPILAGEFTVTANKGDDRCTITRTSVRYGRSKAQCSLKLEEVLHKLADMGATYSDAFEVLRKADHFQCLSCRLAVDALPQATSVYDLAKAGAGDPELLKTHPEILNAKADFGATPNLFEKGRGQSHPVIEQDEDTTPRERKTKFPAEKLLQ
jgi:hypothetical protein